MNLPTPSHPPSLLQVPLDVPTKKQCILNVKPYTDLGVSAPIAMQRRWESYNTALLMAILQSGDTFLDIGAHVGYFSVVAADKVGETGRVYAFEPEPENAALLRQNMIQNGFEDRFSLYDCAVGASDKTETLFRADSNHGGHQLAHPYRDMVDTEGITVSTRPLDDLMEEDAGLQKVDFIKMDVQGYEVMALQGMQQLIEKNREHLVMLMEFSPSLLARFENEGAGINGFLSWLKANATDVFYVKRTPNADLSVAIARIDEENLLRLSDHLLAQSEADNEDRCADLCCVFSASACEKMLVKAGKRPYPTAS